MAMHPVEIAGGIFGLLCIHGKSYHRCYGQSGLRTPLGIHWGVSNLQAKLVNDAMAIATSLLTMQGFQNF